MQQYFLDKEGDYCWDDNVLILFVHKRKILLTLIYTSFKVSHERNGSYGAVAPTEIATLNYQKFSADCVRLSA